LAGYWKKDWKFHFRLLASFQSADPQKRGAEQIKIIG
jgi:hypothetical protein